MGLKTIQKASALATNIIPKFFIPRNSIFVAKIVNVWEYNIFIRRNIIFDKNIFYEHKYKSFKKYYLG